MQKKLFILNLILLLCLPVTSHAIGLEIAGGTWYQSPSGYLAFDDIVPDDQLDRVLDFEATIKQQDVVVEADFSGPFAEVGFEF